MQKKAHVRHYLSTADTITEQQKTLSYAIYSTDRGWPLSNTWVLMYNDASLVDKVLEEARHRVSIFSNHSSTTLTQTKPFYLKLHYSHCCCALLVHQPVRATATSGLPFEKTD